MAQTNINIRMDEGLKQQFDWLCGELGLTMSGAFNIFAKTMVRQKRIPFEVSLEIPNEETLAAMEDAKTGKNISKPFRSVEALMEDLNA